MKPERTAPTPRSRVRRLDVAACAAVLLLAASAACAQAGARSGPEIVQNTCILCHGPGLSGAPRIGSVKDWRPRSRFGLDALVRSATEGKGAMPARGGMPDLTDEELRAAIAYMSGLELRRDER